MRARAHCAHPCIRDHWMQRCIRRCPDHVVSLKRDPQCLSPQADLVLIYRPTVAGIKDLVHLAQPGNRTWTCGVETRYATTRPPKTLSIIINGRKNQGLKGHSNPGSTPPLCAPLPVTNRYLYL
ncbi:hypothetical protein TNCV_972501 [Trichonephila clavipes]|nr:hypothetical protein TNCV_972501 [Trichonephila clavipes]